MGGSHACSSIGFLSGCSMLLMAGVGCGSMTGFSGTWLCSNCKRLVYSVRCEKGQCTMVLLYLVLFVSWLSFFFLLWHH